MWTTSITQEFVIILCCSESTHAGPEHYANYIRLQLCMRQQVHVFIVPTSQIPTSSPAAFWGWNWTNLSAKQQLFLQCESVVRFEIRPWHGSATTTARMEKAYMRSSQVHTAFCCYLCLMYAQSDIISLFSVVMETPWLSCLDSCIFLCPK